MTVQKTTVQKWQLNKLLKTVFATVEKFAESAAKIEGTRDEGKL
jgi:hypothetical protein